MLGSYLIIGAITLFLYSIFAYFYYKKNPMPTWWELIIEGLGIALLWPLFATGLLLWGICKVVGQGQ